MNKYWYVLQHDEFLKHYEWVIRHHILYNSTYSKCPEEANLEREKVAWSLPRAEGGREQDLLLIVQGFFS